MMEMVSKHAIRGISGSISAIILVLAICGCLNPPSNLTKLSDYPCSIKWQDNSDDEDGFNIYLGCSCAHNCSNCTDDQMTKVASVGANAETYNWSESCCDVAECSCVMVRAYKGDEESSNSNIIMLAPVC